MPIKEKTNARKESIRLSAALEMLKSIDRLYVCKGKKVTQLNPKKEKPDKQTLGKLLLGPTGNVRAPIIRTGRTLIIGFNEDVYSEVFG